MTPRAVLVGPPGAGKSTIGRRLAHALDVELFDTDVAIERHSGRTVAEIFAQDGEPAFRTLEEKIVRDALAEHDGVVSLGGGSILSSATRTLLGRHTVIYLEISVAEGLRRTSSNTARPLLAGPDPRARYQELMRHRRPLYRSVASIRMRTDGRSPARVVAQLVTKLENYAAGRKGRFAEETEQPDTAPRQMAHPAARAIRRDNEPHTDSSTDPDSGTDKSEVSQ